MVETDEFNGINLTFFFGSRLERGRNQHPTCSHPKRFSVKLVFWLNRVHFGLRCKMHLQGIFEPKFPKHAWARLELRVPFPYPCPLSLTPRVAAGIQPLPQHPVFCDVKCTSRREVWKNNLMANSRRERQPHNSPGVFLSALSASVTGKFRGVVFVLLFCSSVFVLSPSPSPNQGFPVSLCRPGWTWIQRSTCLSLLSAEIKDGVPPSPAWSCKFLFYTSTLE